MSGGVAELILSRFGLGKQFLRREIIAFSPGAQAAWGFFFFPMGWVQVWVWWPQDFSFFLRGGSVGLLICTPYF